MIENASYFRPFKDENNYILSLALDATHDANLNFSGSRVVPDGLVIQVVNRVLDSVDNQPFSVRRHEVITEVSHFIELFQKNKVITASAHHTDLLPVSHPRSTQSHLLSPQEIRAASARWIADDPSIKDEETRALVAAMLVAPAGSPEREYYKIRIENLPQGSVPVRAMVAALLPGANNYYWMRQRRDRKGRFADEFGGLSSLVRMLSGEVRRLSGRTVGAGQGYFDMETEPGKLARVPANSAITSKAYLPSPDAEDGFSPVPARVSASDEVVDYNDLVYPEAPGEFKEVTDWSPSQEEKEYYGEDADFGKVYSDGNYEIRKFDSGQSPVARDNFQLAQEAEKSGGPIVTNGGGENGSFDPDQPVMFARRLDDTENPDIFAAGQSWSDTMADIRADEQRYEKKQAPDPQALRGRDTEVPKKDEAAPAVETIPPTDETGQRISYNQDQLDELPEGSVVQDSNSGNTFVKTKGELWRRTDRPILVSPPERLTKGQAVSEKVAEDARKEAEASDRRFGPQEGFRSPSPEPTPEPDRGPPAALRIPLPGPINPRIPGTGPAYKRRRPGARKFPGKGPWGRTGPAQGHAPYPIPGRRVFPGEISDMRPGSEMRRYNYKGGKGFFSGFLRNLFSMGEEQNLRKIGPNAWADLKTGERFTDDEVANMAASSGYESTPFYGLATGPEVRPGRFIEHMSPELFKDMPMGSELADDINPLGAFFPAYRKIGYDQWRRWDGKVLSDEQMRQVSPFMQITRVGEFGPGAAPDIPNRAIFPRGPLSPQDFAETPTGAVVSLKDPESDKTKYFQRVGVNKWRQLLDGKLLNPLTSFEDDDILEMSDNIMLESLPWETDTPRVGLPPAMLNNDGMRALPVGALVGIPEDYIADFAPLKPEGMSDEKWQQELQKVKDALRAGIWRKQGDNRWVNQAGEVRTDAQIQNIDETVGFIMSLGDRVDVPKNYYELNREEPYTPQGAVEGQTSPDYTDDPVQLAQKFSEADLKVGLQKALKNPQGFGELLFEDAFEPVPAEALYYALANKIGFALADEFVARQYSEGRELDVEKELSREYPGINSSDPQERQEALTEAWYNTWARAESLLFDDDGNLIVYGTDGDSEASRYLLERIKAEDWGEEYLKDFIEEFGEVFQEQSKYRTARSFDKLYELFPDLKSDNEDRRKEAVLAALDALLAENEIEQDAEGNIINVVPKTAVTKMLWDMAQPIIGKEFDSARLYANAPEFPPLLEGLTEEEKKQIKETGDLSKYLPENPEFDNAWENVYRVFPEPADRENLPAAADPFNLARASSTEELKEQLRKAIIEQNGVAYVRYQNRDGEFNEVAVPAEALRDALQLRDEDANEFINEIYNSVQSPAQQIKNILQEIADLENQYKEETQRGRRAAITRQINEKKTQLGARYQLIRNLEKREKSLARLNRSRNLSEERKAEVESRLTEVRDLLENQKKIFNDDIEKGQNLTPFDESEAGTALDTFDWEISPAPATQGDDTKPTEPTTTDTGPAESTSDTSSTGPVTTPTTTTTSTDPFDYSTDGSTDSIISSIEKRKERAETTRESLLEDINSGSFSDEEVSEKKNQRSELQTYIKRLKNRIIKLEEEIPPGPSPTDPREFFVRPGGYKPGDVIVSDYFTITRVVPTKIEDDPKSPYFGEQLVQVYGYYPGGVEQRYSSNLDGRSVDYATIPVYRGQPSPPEPGDLPEVLQPNPEDYLTAEQRNQPGNLLKAYERSSSRVIYSPDRSLFPEAFDRWEADYLAYKERLTNQLKDQQNSWSPEPLGTEDGQEITVASSLINLTRDVVPAKDVKPGDILYRKDSDNKASAVFVVESVERIEKPQNAPESSAAVGESRLSPERYSELFEEAKNIYEKIDSDDPEKRKTAFQNLADLWIQEGLSAGEVSIEGEFFVTTEGEKGDRAQWILDQRERVNNGEPLSSPPGEPAEEASEPPTEEKIIITGHHPGHQQQVQEWKPETPISIVRGETNLPPSGDLSPIPSPQELGDPNDSDYSQKKQDREESLKKSAQRYSLDFDALERQPKKRPVTQNDKQKNVKNTSQRTEKVAFVGNVAELVDGKTAEEVKDELLNKAKIAYVDVETSGKSRLGAVNTDPPIQVAVVIRQGRKELGRKVLFMNPEESLGGFYYAQYEALGNLPKGTTVGIFVDGSLVTYTNRKNKTRWENDSNPEDFFTKVTPFKDKSDDGVFYQIDENGQVFLAENRLKDPDGNPITDEFLASQPGVEQQLKEFFDFIDEDALLSAYNGDFDINVLAYWAERLGLNFENKGFFDPYPIAVSRRGQRGKGYNSLQNVAIANGFAPEIEKWHDAENDVDALIHVAEAFLESLTDDEVGSPVADSNSYRKARQDAIDALNALQATSPEGEPEEEDTDETETEEEEDTDETETDTTAEPETVSENIPLNTPEPQAILRESGAPGILLDYPDTSWILDDQNTYAVSPSDVSPSELRPGDFFLASDGKYYELLGYGTDKDYNPRTKQQTYVRRDIETGAVSRILVDPTESIDFTSLRRRNVFAGLSFPDTVRYINEIRNNNAKMAIPKVDSDDEATRKFNESINQSLENNMTESVSDTTGIEAVAQQFVAEEGGPKGRNHLDKNGNPLAVGDEVINPKTNESGTVHQLIQEHITTQTAKEELFDVKSLALKGELPEFKAYEKLSTNKKENNFGDAYSIAENEDGKRLAAFVAWNGENWVPIDERGHRRYVNIAYNIIKTRDSETGKVSNRFPADKIVSVSAPKAEDVFSEIAAKRGAVKLGVDPITVANRIDRLIGFVRPLGPGYQKSIGDPVKAAIRKFAAGDYEGSNTAIDAAEDMLDAQFRAKVARAELKDYVIRRANAMRRVVSRPEASEKVKETYEKIVRSYLSGNYRQALRLLDKLEDISFDRAAAEAGRRPTRLSQKEIDEFTKGVDEKGTPVEILTAWDKDENGYLVPREIDIDRGEYLRTVNAALAGDYKMFDADGNELDVQVIIDEAREAGADGRIFDAFRLYDSLAWARAKYLNRDNEKFIKEGKDIYDIYTSKEVAQTIKAMLDLARGETPLGSFEEYQEKADAESAEVKEYLEKINESAASLNRRIRASSPDEPDRAGTVKVGDRVGGLPVPGIYTVKEAYFNEETKKVVLILGDPTLPENGISNPVKTVELEPKDPVFVYTRGSRDASLEDEMVNQPASKVYDELGVPYSSADDDPRRDSASLSEAMKVSRAAQGDMKDTYTTEDQEPAAMALPTSKPVPGENKPTPEQVNIIDAIKDGVKRIKVLAFAGAGKTTTFEMAAKSILKDDPKAKILMVMFNKGLAKETRKRMPEGVEVRTSGQLAYKALKGKQLSKRKNQKAVYSYDSEEKGIKKGNPMYPNIARKRSDKIRALKLPAQLKVEKEIISGSGQFQLKELSQSDLLRMIEKAQLNFAQSKDLVVGPEHFPSNYRNVSPEIVAYAQKYFDESVDPDGVLPLEHEHVVKLWSLNNPNLTKAGSGVNNAGASYLFFDEAQDINPVVEGVMENQQDFKSMIWVGDPHQAIYQFMGAINALSDFVADKILTLSESFRFGKNIASIVNRSLTYKGEKRKVKGSNPNDGYVAPSAEDNKIIELLSDRTKSKVLLSKTNVGGVREIQKLKEKGYEVVIDEGTLNEIIRVLRGIDFLKERDRNPGIEAPKDLYEELQEFDDFTGLREELGEGGALGGRVPAVLNAIKPDQYNTQPLREIYQSLPVVRDIESMKRADDYQRISDVSGSTFLLNDESPAYKDKVGKQPSAAVIAWITPNGLAVRSFGNYKAQDVSDKEKDDLKFYLKNMFGAKWQKTKFPEQDIKKIDSSVPIPQREDAWVIEFPRDLDPTKLASWRLDTLNQIRKHMNNYYPFEGQDPISFTTTHRAKGAQWDVVIIGSDFKAPKMDLATGKLERPSEEDLNLNYVALSRAKEALALGSLSWYTSVTKESDGDYVPDTTDDQEPAAYNVPSVRQTRRGFEKEVNNSDAVLSEDMQKVVDEVQKAVANGKVPWTEPWESGRLPQSATTGTEYSGTNRLYLQAFAANRGFNSNVWLTPSEVERRGGTVKQGEEPVSLTVWVPNRTTVVDDDGNEITTVKSVSPARDKQRLYNADQISGLNIEDSPSESRPTSTPDEAEQKLLSAYPNPPRIAAPGQATSDVVEDIKKKFADWNPEVDTAAIFIPQNDTIFIKPPSEFPSKEKYLEALFHEIVHSTGSKSRLNRPYFMGATAKAKLQLSPQEMTDLKIDEEIIAQIGSAYMAARLGVRLDSENVNAYIRQTLEVSGSDENYTDRIVRLAREAERAVNYIFRNSPASSNQKPTINDLTENAVRFVDQDSLTNVSSTSDQEPAAMALPQTNPSDFSTPNTGIEIDGPDAANLTAEQQDALEWYTDIGYERINALLRAPEGAQPAAAGTEAEREAAQELRSLTDGSRTTSEAVLYRGRPFVNAQRADEFMNLKPGDVVSDDGFISTTTSPERANFYANMDLSNVQGRGVWKINIPENSSAYRIPDEFATNPRDEEILLPPGSQLRVERVVDVDGMRYVEATLSRGGSEASSGGDSEQPSESDSEQAFTKPLPEESTTPQNFKNEVSETKSKTQEISEKVTEMVVKAIEGGKELPWKKPWNGENIFSMPYSVTTNKPYRGFNIFILWAAGMANDWEDNRWITFNEAKKRGGSVKKGSKGTQIVNWSPVKKKVEQKDGTLQEEVVFMKPTVHTVFNVEQTEGVQDLPEPDLMDPVEVTDAERVALEKYTDAPPIINKMQDEAFWRPSTDEVVMPLREQFPGVENYLETLFHELVHSTGHESRLNRKDLSEKYSTHRDARGEEELIAELGAALLASRMGLSLDLENVAGYAQSWLRPLQNNPEMIAKAAQQAQAAVDYILGENKPNLGSAGATGEERAAEIMDSRLNLDAPDPYIGDYGIAAADLIRRENEKEQEPSTEPGGTTNAEQFSSRSDEFFTENEKKNYKQLTGITPEESEALDDYTTFGYREINPLLRDPQKMDKALEGSLWTLKQLTSLMEKSSLEKDTTVYRGTTSRAFGFDPKTLSGEGAENLEDFDYFQKVMQNLKKGTIISLDPAFMSASKDKKVAQRFMFDAETAEKADDGYGNVKKLFDLVPESRLFLEISAKKDTKAIDVNQTADTLFENLRKNSDFSEKLDEVGGLFLPALYYETTGEQEIIFSPNQKFRVVEIISPQKAFEEGLYEPYRQSSPEADLESLTETESAWYVRLEVINDADR